MTATMAKRADGFATIRRARSLRERRPEATSSHVAVFVVFATYADGATGGNIFPGHEMVGEHVGLGERQFSRIVGDLKRWGELVQHNEGRVRKKTAAYYSIAGVGLPDDASVSPSPATAYDVVSPSPATAYDVVSPSPATSIARHRRRATNHSTDPPLRATPSRSADEPECAICGGETTIVESDGRRVATCSSGCSFAVDV